MHKLLERPRAIGGFSRARLDRMDRAMRRHVESGYTPGLVKGSYGGE